jgi:glutamine amidotransferase-like uncharacterized protein
MNSFNLILNIRILKLVILLFAFIVAVWLAGCNPLIEKVSLAKNEKIRVGVYNGLGASEVCVIETLEALKIDSGICEQTISPVEIQMGKLDSIDVLIFPGGSGSKEYNSLGVSSVRIVQKFAATKGKGIVGICAGGYLFTSTPGYPSLEILAAVTIRDYYDRGRGLIAFYLDDSGYAVFPELMNNDTLFIQYYDGPIYENIDSSKIQIVGTILSDITTRNNYPKGVTPGKPAFLISTYGEGKVFVSVGHPESTLGMRWIVPRMARYVADKPLISYDETIIRPGLNNCEILYYSDVIKHENDAFWKLTGNDKDVVLQALTDLNSIRSRPSIRWSIGLLRSDSREVRLAAARYLVETEYTFAIPDMECAVLIEKDAALKTELQQNLTKLKNIIKN